MRWVRRGDMIRKTKRESCGGGGEDGDGDGDGDGGEGGCVGEGGGGGGDGGDEIRVNKLRENPEMIAEEL